MCIWERVEEREQNEIEWFVRVLVCGVTGREDVAFAFVWEECSIVKKTCVGVSEWKREYAWICVCVCVCVHLCVGGFAKSSFFAARINDGFGKWSDWRSLCRTGVWVVVWDSVWPDDGIKSCPILPSIAQKVAKPFLCKSCSIWNRPKFYQNSWATFVKKMCYQEVKKNCPIWSHWWWCRW